MGGFGAQFATAARRLCQFYGVLTCLVRPALVGLDCPDFDRGGAVRELVSGPFCLAPVVLEVRAVAFYLGAAKAKH